MSGLYVEVHFQRPMTGLCIEVHLKRPMEARTWIAQAKG